MSTDGHIQVVGVNGIEFVDDGQSLRLEIVETIPPYNSSFVIFKNVRVTKLFQSGCDVFPLTVVDLTWTIISARDKKKVLADHGFPFFNESGSLTVSHSQLVLAHFEGDLVGDVIAEDVILEDQ